MSTENALSIEIEDVKNNRMTPMADGRGYMSRGQKLGYTTEEMAVSIERIAFDNGIPMLDSNESLVLAQALEQLIPKVVENPPLPLKGLEVFNLARAEEWTEEVKWSEVSTSGRMEPVSDTGSSNLPDVSAGAREQVNRVATYGMCVSWSFMDFVRAARMIQPINQVKLMAARRIHDETLNDLIWNGNDALGLKGLLNQKAIPEVQAAAPFSGLSGSALATAILNQIVSIDDATETVEAPNTLLLPPSIYNQLVLTRQGSDDNTDSLLEEIQKKAALLTENPGFMIRKVRELKSDSNSRGTNIMVLLNNSPEVVQYHMSMIYRQFPVQQADLRFRVPIMMRPGGLSVYRPKAIRIVRGI